MPVPVRRGIKEGKQATLQAIVGTMFLVPSPSLVYEQFHLHDKSGWQIDCTE